LPIAQCPLLNQLPIFSVITFMPRKKKKPTEPLPHRKPFHDKLEGFDIKVNTFGEIKTSFDIDKINKFLDEEVEDKKIDDDTIKKSPDE
jgi:hypothetical protein